MAGDRSSMGDQVRRRPASCGLTLAPMPERVAVSGVGFIEFSADPADAADLAIILKTLGFRETGMDRFKQVHLYEQGTIRILVNTEKVGFANAAYSVHGTLPMRRRSWSMMRPRRWRARSRWEQNRSAKRLGPGKSRYPPSAAWAADCSISWNGGADLGRIWDIDFLAGFQRS